MGSGCQNGSPICFLVESKFLTLFSEGKQLIKIHSQTSLTFSLSLNGITEYRIYAIMDLYSLMSLGGVEFLQSFQSTGISWWSTSGILDFSCAGRLFFMSSLIAP